MFFKRGKSNKSNVSPTFGANNVNSSTTSLDLQKHADFIRETKKELYKLHQKKSYTHSALHSGDGNLTSNSSNDSIDPSGEKASAQDIDGILEVTVPESSNESKESDKTPKEKQSYRNTLRRSLSLPPSSRVKSVAKIPSSFTPRKIKGSEERPRASTTIEVNNSRYPQVEVEMPNDHSCVEKTNNNDNNKERYQNSYNKLTNKNYNHEQLRIRQVSNQLSASNIADSVWEVICQQSGNYSLSSNKNNATLSKTSDPKIRLGQDIKDCNVATKSSVESEENTLEKASHVVTTKENEKHAPILQKQVARTDLSSSPQPLKKIMTDFDTSPGGSLVVTKVLNIEKEKVSVVFTYRNKTLPRLWSRGLMEHVPFNSMILTISNSVIVFSIIILTFSNNVTLSFLNNVTWSFLNNFTSSFLNNFTWSFLTYFSLYLTPKQLTVLSWNFVYEQYSWETTNFLYFLTSYLNHVKFKWRPFINVF